MRLSDLLQRVEPLSVHGPTDVEVLRVTEDSRDADPCSVFVAIRGARVDGHAYASRVQAAVVVAERAVEAPGTLVVVEDSRIALARIASALHGEPSSRLRVVGITGTNGKTTTSLLLESVLERAGVVAGVIGTTGHKLAGQHRDASYTSPPAPAWQALLADMVVAGCEVVATEVSSIGLSAHRVDATAFEVGVFTNLSRDHLDVHGTMEAYAGAKRRLFTDLVRVGGTAVVNVEDPWAERVAPHRGEVTRWGFGLDGGDLRPERLTIDLDGARGRLATPLGPMPLDLKLLGRHNVQNALAAVGAGLALGIDPEAVAAGVAAVRSVPGRLEPVAGAPGFHLLVDYAHTPDALTVVLASLAELTAGRRIVVFGCGGDRDRGKRPLMAEAASAAELVVATSDNPRSEAPGAILDDLRPGLRADAHVIEDREEAIAHAVSLARPGDVVLVAGKGHETYQEIAGVKHPFDDRRVAARALEQL